MKNRLWVLAALLTCDVYLMAEEGCAKANAKVQLASKEAEKAAGIEVAEVQSRELSEEVIANARVAFDATRTAKIGPAVAGILRAMPKRLGDEVAVGDAVLVVDSPALGVAKSECLSAATARDLALANAKRERELAGKSATSQRELQLAEAELASTEAALARAREQLKTFGFSNAEVDRTLRERDGSSRLTVPSPLAGTIVTWDGVVGEMLDPAKPVATVTDLTHLWVMADVFEKDLVKVAVGQAAVFVADADPDREFAGTVEWVASILNSETRTLPVRISVKNPERFLKTNLFGKVRICVRKTGEAIVVPKEAVQWEGCCHMVFVPAGPQTYQGHGVKLGYSGGGFYEILSGLSVGEKVVTQGSFLLKTEVLKSSIGAG